MGEGAKVAQLEADWDRLGRALGVIPDYGGTVAPPRSAPRPAHGVLPSFALPGPLTAAWFDGVERLRIDRTSALLVGLDPLNRVEAAFYADFLTTLYDVQEPEAVRLARQGRAGDPSLVWISEFLPIARTNGGAEYLLLDNRPGDSQGCIKTFDHVLRSIEPPVAKDLAELLAHLVAALRGDGLVAGYRFYAFDPDMGFWWEPA